MTQLIDVPAGLSGGSPPTRQSAPSTATVAGFHYGPYGTPRSLARGPGRSRRWWFLVRNGRLPPATRQQRSGPKLAAPRAIPAALEPAIDVIGRDEASMLFEASVGALGRCGTSRPGPVIRLDDRCSPGPDVRLAALVPVARPRCTAVAHGPAGGRGGPVPGSRSCLPATRRPARCRLGRGAGGRSST